MPWIRYIPDDMNLAPNTNPFAQNPKVKIVGGTSGDCMNTPVTINALRAGAIIKVPVVLAELELQLSIDAMIDLPMPALEVKNIRKDIKIMECLLLHDTHTLFIKGAVRKTIEYSYSPVFNYKGLSDSIRQCTVELPFGGTTSVSFNGIQPVLSIPSNLTEFECHSKQDSRIPTCLKTEPALSECSMRNQISTKYYNELPYCELVSSKIVEHDRFLKHIQADRLVDKIPRIKGIEEKLALYLTIKILQNCQIAIPPMALCAILDKDPD